MAPARDALEVHDDDLVGASRVAKLRPQNKIGHPSEPPAFAGSSSPHPRPDAAVTISAVERARGEERDDAHRLPHHFFEMRPLEPAVEGRVCDREVVELFRRRALEIASDMD